MKRPRIAVIGDTALSGDDLSDAGAIAIELARTGQADSGFRSVATNAHALYQIESRLSTHGVRTWLTMRKQSDLPGEEPIRADLRMGDPIDIAEIFNHDVVVLASRDVRLRRFLSDLPVHTRPDVRILALLHFEDGAPLGERVEDLLRFDTIAGSERDFDVWGHESDLPTVTRDDPPIIRSLHAMMHGANSRAIVSWADDGSATLAEPLKDIITVAPVDVLRGDRSSAPWAAFVATLAIGMAHRQPYPEVTRLASAAFITRSRGSRPHER